jgi:hypothetical protein
VANPNVSELATTTIEHRNKKLQDNVTKNNALLMRLQKKGNVRPFNGGTQINEEISYAENANAQWYSGYETLAVGATDTFTSATFNIKQLAVPVTISGLEELMNSGEAQMIDLLTQRIKNAEGTMANKIAQGIYSDGTTFGGKTITGLDAAVPQDPTTGTYGGINRATAGNTFWRSQLTDPASTPTVSTIQGIMNTLWALCVRGMQRPDLIASGATIWATYLGSLQPLQRFTSPDTADLGFESIKYMTADVVLDGGIGGFATATDMYYLNTDVIYFRPHADRNMSRIGKERQSVNQDASVVLLGFAGNLTSSGPQFCGRLKGD